MEAIGEQGELDLSAMRQIEEVDSGYTQFFDGDVVVAKITPCFENGKGALISGTFGGVGFGTTELHVLTPAPELDGRFLYFITASSPFRRLGEASMTGAAGQKRVPEDFVRDFRIPVPPLPQQRAIADYLDRETARLDALVAAKERVLGLLAEKRRALITRAVTRGLDSRVPLRDSGIPWLGEIPTHWRSMRLRFLMRHLEQGWSPEAENREPGENEWGVLKLNAVSRGRFDPSAAKALPIDLVIRTDLEVHRGDFLVTRSNTPSLVGDACFVDEARPRLMLCDLIYRLTLREGTIDGRFLGYFLTLPEGRGQVEADARGTSGSMVKISQEHIKDWWIPLPPLDEQVAIVSQVGREAGALDKLRSATERTIALLKERRAALIAAAVTGKIRLANEEASCISLA
jgi:type I restriction enzyme S subunit